MTVLNKMSRTYTNMNICLKGVDLHMTYTEPKHCKRFEH